MARVSLPIRCAALLALLAGSTDLYAVNEFRVVGRDLPLSSTGNVLEVEADLDQDTYALSIAIDFDESKLQLAEVRPGVDVAALNPEYVGGAPNNSNGTLSWGVVFSLSAGTIDNHLNAGDDRRVLELDIDVLATNETSTQIQLVQVPGNLGRFSTMTDVDGNSVSPDPTLTSATIQLSEVGPVIESLLPDSGVEGTDILISGRNFGQPGLEVRICGVLVDDAEVIGLGGGTIRLTAPACATVGPAEVEVCTDLGCASLAGGFTYDEVDPPDGEFVRGNANNDATIDLSDGVSIFAVLFQGATQAAPCTDALDSNDDGSTDISDGIYLLNFLFQGGLAPPAPYPDPGTDPTPDSLPACL